MCVWDAWVLRVFGRPVVVMCACYVSLSCVGVICRFNVCAKCVPCVGVAVFAPTHIRTFDATAVACKTSAATSNFPPRQLHYSVSLSHSHTHTHTHDTHTPAVKKGDQMREVGGLKELVHHIHTHAHTHVHTHTHTHARTHTHTHKQPACTKNWRHGP